ncbi:MAG: hypothetical protein QMC73_12505, partial [Myxococcota bacterium]
QDARGYAAQCSTQGFEAKLKALRAQTDCQAIRSSEAEGTCSKESFQEHGKAFAKVEFEQTQCEEIALWKIELTEIGV